MRLRAAAARVTRDHLYRGALLLLANTVLLALFGFAFWSVAARSYDASSLGVFAGVVSAVTLLTAIAALGFPNTLMRHLAGTVEQRALVGAVLVAVTVLGGALCLAFVELLGTHLPVALHLQEEVSTPLLLLLVAVSAVSTVTDAGLVALRGVEAMLRKNVAGAALKVALLPVFAGSGTAGLVWAYTVGSVTATVLGVVALWRRTPLAGNPGAAQGVRLLRRHASFSLGTYLGTTAGILPLTVVPLMVLATRGAREAAWFAIAFMLAGFLNFIPSTASQALFAEASREPGAAGQAARKALRAIFTLLVPSVALVVVLAPVLLSLFGEQYREGATTALRLLALGTLFAGGAYVVDSLLAARDRVVAYVVMNVVNAALVLGLVGVLLHRGLAFAGLGWLIAQALTVAIGIGALVVTAVWRPAIRRRRMPSRASAGSADARGEITTGTLGARRLRFLDGLRGIAALYVVVSHGWATVFPHPRETSSALQYLTEPLAFGRFAVALFIVISGFSLGMTAWKRGFRWPGGVRAFATRRARRILPPYLLAVAACSIVGATILAEPSGTLYDGAIPIRPEGVLVHLGLLQDVVWRGPAGSTAFWSIAVEVHIYVAFALALVLLRRRTALWLPAVVALAAITVGAYMTPWSPVSHWVTGMYPGLYALFLLGVAASRFAVPQVAPDPRRWERLLFGFLAVGLAVQVLCISRFDPAGPLNDLWLGPLCALLVTRLVRGGLAPLHRVFASRPLVWLGQASYSLYLIHAFVVEMVWRWVVTPLGAGVAASLALEIVIASAASVVVARGFYFVVERPFLVTRPAIAPSVEAPVLDPSPARKVPVHA